MKWALDGHPSDQDLPPEWREFVVCSHFGWTKTEFDEQPAAWTDWMFQFIPLMPHTR